MLAYIVRRLLLMIPTLFGVLLLNEPLTPQLVLALAGVTVGFVLVNRKPAG